MCRGRTLPMKSVHRCLGQRAKPGGHAETSSKSAEGAVCHNALWEKASLVRAPPALAAISPMETKHLEEGGATVILHYQS